MSMLRRVRRLEAQANSRAPCIAQMTDDELDARLLDIARQLAEMGDEEGEADVAKLELSLGSTAGPRSASRSPAHVVRSSPGPHADRRETPAPR